MSPINNNTTFNNTEDGYPRAGHLVGLGIDISAANEAAVVDSVVVVSLALPSWPLQRAYRTVSLQTSATSTVFPFAVLEGHVLNDQGVAMVCSAPPLPSSVRC